MDITRGNINAVFTSFATRYQSAYGEASTWFERVSTTVPSGSRSTKQIWLSLLPRMREWVGERIAHNLSANEYELKNKDYELTVEVERNDIMDDQLGVYAPIVDHIGRSAKKHPDDLMVDLFRNGNAAASVTYDGKPFFATDHPVSMSDATAQANYGTSTALNATNYAAKRAAMMTYKGEDGRPLGIVPNLLVVPPQLEATARTILNADMVSDGAGAGISNVHRGSADLLVIPELSVDATAWYLLDTSKVIKPFVFQQRMQPNFVKKTEVTDDNVFYLKKFIMGVDSRDVGGYGLWFTASKWVG